MYLSLWLVSLLFFQDEPKVDYTEVVRVTRIPVLVQREGKRVKDVSLERVRVFENGMESKVLAVESVELANTIHILFDLSASQEDHLRHAQRLSRDLIRAVNPEDRIKISTFSGIYRSVTEYSADHVRHLEAIKSLQTRGTTALYEGILASLEELRTETGPRVLVVLSDGVDIVSQRRESELGAVVKSYGVPIFLVQFSKGELKGETLIQGLERFKEIVHESGGTVRFADFSAARGLAREIRDYATRTEIIYLPPNPEDLSQWRHVQINIADCSHCELEYRRAYQINDH